MRQLFALLLVFSVALTVAGCGKPACTDLCKKENDCPGAQQSNCTDVCNENQTITDTSKCNEKYDALLKCVSDGVDKICTDENLCKSQSDAFKACVIAYCVLNPSTSFCQV